MASAANPAYNPAAAAQAQANFNADPNALAQTENGSVITSPGAAPSNPGTISNNSGSSGGSTTTAPTPSPLTQPFNNALNSVIGYYNQIFNTEPQAVGSAAALANQGYASQIGGLNNSYAQAQAQVPWQLVGRGAGSSSWADNANAYANNAYNNSLSGIQSAQQTDLDQLQKQADTDTAEGQYFVNTEAPQLRSIFPNLDSYYQNAQVGQLLGQAQQLAGQTGGNLPVNQLAAQLQANPIYNQQGSNQIAGLEGQLAGTGAPQAIQNQILAGINSNNNPVIPNILTNLQAPAPVGG